jgi:hypothetical protein
VNTRTAIIRNSFGSRQLEPRFKAADVMGNGWTGVHICDQNNQIYWPEAFDQLGANRTLSAVS